jgi:hypothetical protein
MTKQHLKGEAPMSEPSVLAIERRRLRSEVVPIVKTAASRGAL